MDQKSIRENAPKSAAHQAANIIEQAELNEPLPAIAPPLSSVDEGDDNLHVISSDDSMPLNLLEAITNPSLHTETSKLYRFAIYAKQYHSVQAKLFNIIEKSKNNPGRAIEATNAITILNLACVSFSHKDFSGVHIPGANLSGSILYKTQFDGADLSNVDFRSALIAHSAFNNAQLHNTHFGEKPTLAHFEAPITCLAFAPNTNRLAYTTSDFFIHFQEIHNDHPLSQFKHPSIVFSLQFSPDGTLLATGAEDGRVRIWDYPSLQCIATLNRHGNWIRSVAFHPHKPLLASASDDTNIHVWDTEKWTLMKVLNEHEESVSDIAFSPDGIHFASTSYDGTLRLWNTDSLSCQHTLILPGNGTKGYALDYRFDGKRIAVGDANGLVSLWDTGSLQSIKVLKGHDGQVNSVAFSPDGTQLASGSDDTSIRLWDIDSGDTIGTYEGHTKLVSALRFSRDCQWLLSASYDGAIRYWHIDKANPTLKPRLHHSAMKSLKPASNQLVATTDYLGHFILTDSDRRTIISEKGMPFISEALMSRNGKWLVFNKGVTIEAYSIPNFKLENQYHTVKDNPITAIAISGDEQYLFGAQNNEGILIWRMGNEKPINQINNADPLSDATLSQWCIKTLLSTSTGDSLTAQSIQGKLIIIDHHHGKLTPKAKPCCNIPFPAIAYSMDNRCLALGTQNGDILIITVSSNTITALWKGHAKSVNDLAFAPNNTYLASASLDFTIKLWRVDVFNCVGLIEYLASPMYTLSFNLDSRHLYSGSKEGVLYKWDVSTLKQDNAKIRLLARNANFLTLIEPLLEGVKGLSDQNAALIEAKKVAIRSSKSAAIDKPVESNFNIGMTFWRPFNTIPIHNTASLKADPTADLQGDDDSDTTLTQTHSQT